MMEAVDEPSMLKRFCKLGGAPPRQAFFESSSLLLEPKELLMDVRGAEGTSP